MVLKNPKMDILILVKTLLKIDCQNSHIVLKTETTMIMFLSVSTQLNHMIPMQVYATLCFVLMAADHQECFPKKIKYLKTIQLLSSDMICQKKKVGAGFLYVSDMIRLLNYAEERKSLVMLIKFVMKIGSLFIHLVELLKK